MNVHFYVCTGTSSDFFGLFNFLVHLPPSYPRSMKHILLLFVLCIACTATAYSQATTSRTTIESAQDALAQCVYLDSDEKICFLDLEKVPLNLRQAVLINQAGEEVLLKGLNNVPVNSIVELDYSALPAGAYVLELRSYRGIAHKSLQLK